MTGIPCPQTQTECSTLNPPTMHKPIISDALEEAGWGPPGILLSRLLPSDARAAVSCSAGVDRAETRCVGISASPGAQGLTPSRCVINIFGRKDGGVELNTFKSFKI